MLRSILIYIVKLLLHIDELILAIEAHLTQETRLTMSQNQRQQPTKAKRTVIPLHILGLEDGPSPASSAAQAAARRSARLRKISDLFWQTPTAQTPTSTTPAALVASPTTSSAEPTSRLPLERLPLDILLLLLIIDKLGEGSPAFQVMFSLTNKTFARAVHKAGLAPWRGIRDKEWILRLFAKGAPGPLYLGRCYKCWTLVPCHELQYKDVCRKCEQNDYVRCFNVSQEQDMLKGDPPGTRHPTRWHPALRRRLANP